ncbi:hypothetical protein DXG01_012668, partial [Tephrocybe rancida]
PEKIDGLTFDDIQHFQPAEEELAESGGESVMSEVHSTEPAKPKLKRKRSMQSDGGASLSTTGSKREFRFIAIFYFEFILFG